MRSIFLLLPLLLAAEAPPVYKIHTLAGTTWTGDGRSATAAVLVQPSGIAVDAKGKVYIADAGDHRVRCVGSDGAINTVAGTGTAGFTGHVEPAQSSALNSPYGVAVDMMGNLFIADLGNALVRRVSKDGQMITVAGGGSQPPSAVAAPATKVKLMQPRDVAVDRYGNIFIADFGANQVYQITPDGTLRVVLGATEPGTIGAVPLSSPAGIGVDANGVLYIADSGNRRIRKMVGGILTTVTDKDGKEVEFGTPTGLAVDESSRVYVADGAERLTVVWVSGEFLSLPIGGTAVALGPGGEVFTISGKQVLRLTGGSNAVVAGSLNGAGAGDGVSSTQWRFQTPSSIARDDIGNLYIADTGNSRVRMLSATGELSTLTTKLAAPTSVALDSQSRVYAGDQATGAVYRIDPAGQLRLIARTDGRTMTPAAMAFDPLDNLYIADTANDVIRRVSAGGVMTIVAGGGSLTGDGVGLLLKLGAPSGLAFDKDGALWFSEASTTRIRRLLNGRVTTLETAALKGPRGIRIDGAGHLLVADAGLHRVLRVAPDGSWIPLAGSGDRGFSGDGELALAGMLNAPVDVTEAEDGTLLVVDSGNNRIRMLEAENAGEPVIPPPAQLQESLEVLHAGTMKPSAVAPGQLVYISGQDINQANITFGGLPATVIAAVGNRLTVQVPAGLRTGVVEVAALEEKTVRGQAAVDIIRTAPAILTASGGTGQALALNEEGHVNGAGQPTRRTGIVTFFVTGEGAGTGKVTAEIGGYAGDVVWSGPAPGMTAVYQVNVRMPGGFAPSGTVSASLAFDGVKTQSGVTIVSR